MPSAEISQPPVKKQKLTGWIILWAAVLALAAAQVWSWQSNKKRDLDWQTNTAQRLGVLEKTLDEQTARDKQYESRLQLVQEKLVSLESRVNELQTSRLELEKLYRQLLPLRDDLAMREVEYRVRFAMQQLAMGDNVSAALAALQDADAELTALKRPDLAPVKATLTQTVEALQRVPAFDARGFLTRFDQALNAVDRMAPREIPTTLPETKEAVDENAPWWRRWWTETKAAMSSMVRLRVKGDESSDKNSFSKPYLADVTLDRRELRLRLLSLRWMVLTRQSAVSDEAAAAKEWVTQHFSADDPATQSLQALLEELSSSPVAAPLPEISPVLEALRLWRAGQATPNVNEP
jgi:uncharacterized protein HemX